jgi:type I restriction enzyme M protein
MPSKRDVLALLTRDELLAVVDRFELSPPDRRAKDGLVETVASSKRATLAEVLPELSRDRLKDICRALGLDDGGRKKSLLVERLTGSGGGGDSAPARTNGAARAATTVAEVEVAPGEKLTTEKLEGYLWSAADILRGSIDSSDYKGFIFGLLFLKRLVAALRPDASTMASEKKVA